MRWSVNVLAKRGAAPIPAAMDSCLWLLYPPLPAPFPLLTPLPRVSPPFPPSKKNPLWQAQGSALLSVSSHPLQASSCLPFCSLVAPPLLLACPHGEQGETHGHVSSLPSHIPLTPPGSFRDADTSLFLHPKVCRLKGRARPQPPLFLGICLQIPSCSKSPLVCWG